MTAGNRFPLAGAGLTGFPANPHRRYIAGDQIVRIRALILISPKSATGWQRYDQSDCFEAGRGPEAVIRDRRLSGKLRL